MNKSDANEFRTLMLGIGESYGKKVGQAMTSIYWNALADYPIEAVRNGFNAHIRDPDHGMYFPKPADVIRHIDGGSETQATRAWSKLRDAIRRYGHNRTLVFDDWKIHACVHDMGGWQEVCQWQTDKMAFHQRDFEKLYRSMRPGREFPPKLVGHIEHINEQNGHLHALPEPILIGDVEQAAKVLEHEPRQVGQPAGEVMQQIAKRMEHKP